MTLDGLSMCQSSGDPAATLDLVKVAGRERTKGGDLAAGHHVDIAEAQFQACADEHLLGHLGFEGANSMVMSKRLCGPCAGLSQTNGSLPCALSVLLIMRMSSLIWR